MPKGLADPGELSALTRRSGNPSCDFSVTRPHYGLETVCSPLRTARRNYVGAKLGGGEGWIRTNVDGVADRSISPLCHFAFARELSKRAVKRHVARPALAGVGFIAMR